MYPYLLAAAFLPSSILAESLYGLLENTAPMSAWYSLIRPYVGELIDMKRSEPITILVPANDAVNEFTRSSAFQSMDDAGIHQLLMYHVLHGLHRYQDLIPDGPFFRTYLEMDGLSGGQRVQVGGTISSHSQDSDMVYFYSGMGQNTSVWTHTYDSDGTYLLSIDSVLTIPLTVSETAIAAGLTSFAGAVTSINTNLDTVQDATFFAPSNNAFETVGSALNDASTSDLQDILQYHYIDGTSTPLYTSEISTAQHTTAEGNDVMLSYNGQDELFVNSAAVTYTNLLVQNGVLHIID